MTRPPTRQGKMDTRGFTLMELLIVVLFIGILATIAIAGYPYMREKAGDAAAKSDLKNAAVFQEEYYDDNKIYADQTALDAVLDGSENVTLTVLSADANGYNMSATHGASTSTFCISSTDGAVVSC